MLAAVYGCAVAELVDLADREHLPPADLLILDKYSQPGTWSGRLNPQAPRQAARTRIPDPRAGSTRVPPGSAAEVDDLPGAGSELTALAALDSRLPDG